MKNQQDKEPSVVYKTMQTESSVPNVLQRVMKPRDMKQVRNAQHNVRQQSRISKDTLYNLHELAYHLNGFIWKIETFPDLLVVVGLKNVVTEFSKVVDVKLEENSDIRQYFSYDTTFEIGDFFLTPFIFRHILFEGSPMMPLAYMFHERRQQNFHACFIRLLKEGCPAISRAKLPIILDREQAMTNSFRKELPNLDIIYCWNHLKRDVKLWLRKHLATSSEIPFYMDGISSLLSSKTLEEFEDNKQLITENWSQAMNEYFEAHLERDITHHCARFIVEKFGLYDTFSGITNNTSESENAVIKRLVQWKEVTLDTAVLALHMDQQYLYNESLRGRCGLGQFVLRNVFSAAKLEEDEVTFCPISCKFEDIVEFVRTGASLENEEQFENDEDETTENLPPATFQVPDRRSQTAMAIEIEKTGRVVHVPQLKSFMVEGLTGEKYAVSLFPKEKCQCPSSTTCYHILAARLSVNLPIDEGKKQFNLTVLRRNARCRSEKKLGRKHQSLDNKSFTPAPDSRAAKRANKVHGDLQTKKFKIDDFEAGFEAIPEEDDPVVQNEKSHTTRRSLEFRQNEDIEERKQQEPKQQSPSQAKQTKDLESPQKSNHKENVPLNKDEQMTLYELLREYILDIPDDVKEFVRISATDPVLSFYREARQKHSKELDDLSHDLIPLASPTEDPKTIPPSILQLTAAIIVASTNTKVLPFQMIETLNIHPSHLVPCNIARSAPNHSLRVYNNDVGRKDLKTLEGQTWLNDKIIHAYLGILMREKNDIQPNKVFVLPSFLMTKWMKMDYSSWKFSKVDLLSFEDILLPVCVSNH